jgi:hypothetical protein
MVPGGGVLRVAFSATGTGAGATVGASTFAWLGGAMATAAACTTPGCSPTAAARSDGASEPFCDVNPYATPIPTSATTMPAKTAREPPLERTAGVLIGVAGVTVRGSIARTAGESVGTWEMWFRLMSPEPLVSPLAGGAKDCGGA